MTTLRPKRTFKDLADAVGVDRTLISHFKAGRKGFEWEDAKRLAAEIGITPDIIMDGDIDTVLNAIEAWRQQ